MENCDNKCVGCHFFMTNTSYGNKVSASEDFRKAINKNAKDLIIKLINEGSYSQAICYKEIWSWRSYLTTNRVINNDTIIELTKDRKNSCFFFRYSKGMSMKTAEELFIRETQNQKAIPVEVIKPIDVKVEQPFEIEIINPIKIEEPKKLDRKFIITTIIALITLIVAIIAVTDQIKSNSQKKHAESTSSTSPHLSPTPTIKPVKTLTTPIMINNPKRHN